MSTKSVVILVVHTMKLYAVCMSLVEQIKERYEKEGFPFRAIYHHGDRPSKVREILAEIEGGISVLMTTREFPAEFKIQDLVAKEEKSETLVYSILRSGKLDTVIFVDKDPVDPGFLSHFKQMVSSIPGGENLKIYFVDLEDRKKAAGELKKAMEGAIRRAFDQ